MDVDSEESLFAPTNNGAKKSTWPDAGESWDRHRKLLYYRRVWESDIHPYPGVEWGLLIKKKAVSISGLSGTRHFALQKQIKRGNGSFFVCYLSFAKGHVFLLLINLSHLIWASCLVKWKNMGIRHQGAYYTSCLLPEGGQTTSRRFSASSKPEAHQIYTLHVDVPKISRVCEESSCTPRKLWKGNGSHLSPWDKCIASYRVLVPAEIRPTL
jgi:hypothetical protein